MCVVLYFGWPFSVLTKFLALKKRSKVSYRVFLGMRAIIGIFGSTSADLAMSHVNHIDRCGDILVLTCRRPWRPILKVRQNLADIKRCRAFVCSFQSVKVTSFERVPNYNKILIIKFLFGLRKRFFVRADLLLRNLSCLCLFLLDTCSNDLNDFFN